jgi:hypothetical protein
MALKQDAEDVREKADRIVRLILARQQVKFFVNNSEDPEMTLDVTAKMRQDWNDKIAQLQAEIQAIVGAW